MKIVLQTLLICLLWSPNSHASFEENSRRYLSGHEIIQTLNQFFDLSYQCQAIDDRNFALLGLSFPITGNPISPSPTQATIQWLTKCVSESVLTFQFPPTETSLNKLKTLLGPEVSALFTKSAYNGITDERTNLSLHLSKKWMELSPEVQNKLIASMVSSLLGSDDVIRDFDIIEPGVLREKLRLWPQNIPSLTVIQMIQFIAVNLTVRDEFLSY